MALKKVDLINGAYSQMEISGVTVVPTASDYALGLSRLDAMMAELFDAPWNLDFGYDFSSTPNINSYVNVNLADRQKIETNLAVRLMADFGREVPQVLDGLASAGLSAAISKFASKNAKQLQAPSWFPVGSGNRYGVMPLIEEKEATADILTLYRGETRTGLIEDFDSFLSQGTSPATISTKTLVASTGLSVVASAIDGALITYTLTALENGTGNNQIVKITITDSLGRVCIRAASVFVTDPPEV